MAREATKQAWARGGTVLAGTLMLIIGAYQIFLGITALARNQFTVVTPNYYYTVDTTAWGWIHIGIGAAVLLAGFFLFTGSAIARIVAIAMVSLSALGNFFLLPYYPVWAILLIALDIFAIWAIATVRTDYGADLMADEREMAYGGYGPSGTQAQMQTGGMQTGERWPTENQPGGRHWAPENVKEGAQPQPGETPEQAAQRAAASGRTMPPSGNQPPRP